MASDLHIEQHERFVPEDMLNPLANILVLAGDIGSLYRVDQLRTFLTYVCSRFKWIIYVPGNYEYYHINGAKELTMFQLKNNLLRLAKEFPNLFVLDQGYLDIGKEVRVIGATLWSHIKTIRPYIVRIPEMNKELYNKLHKSDLKYLTETIKNARKENKKVMVVTHYPPIPAPHGRKTKFRELYENHLPPEIFHQVSAWVYGHTHDNTEVIDESHQCNFFTNQWGKEKEGVIGYRKNYLIRI